MEVKQETATTTIELEDTVIVLLELEFAKHVADKIIFMEEGKIVEVASPEVFFNNPKTERSKSFLASFDLYK